MAAGASVDGKINPASLFPSSALRGSISLPTTGIPFIIASAATRQNDSALEGQNTISRSAYASLTSDVFPTGSTRELWFQVHIQLPGHREISEAFHNFRSEVESLPLCGATEDADVDGCFSRSLARCEDFGRVDRIRDDRGISWVAQAVLDGDTLCGRGDRGELQLRE
jgi:hypothetical protein